MIDKFECKDCPFVGKTAAEFSNHIRVCPNRPLALLKAVEDEFEERVEGRETLGDA